VVFRGGASASLLSLLPPDPCVKVIPKMLRKIAFHLLVMIMMADGRKRRQRRHHGRHEFKAFSGDMRNTTCERGWATCHVRQVERFGKARFFSQCGQDQFAFEHLGLRRLKGSRYFVEMGARNGLDDSNTLFYEETLGWRGLLVEAQPAFYEHLSRNRPRAHVLHGAIGRHSNCTFNDVRMANGMIEPGWSGLTPQNVPKGAALAPYPVRCYELAPVLRLLKMQRVDYFSLDVEGSELAVLESIDWGQVNIGVLGVESYAAHDESIRTLLRRQGLHRVSPPAPLRTANGYGNGIKGYPPTEEPQPCWPDWFYVKTSWPELRRWAASERHGS
jgi:FkbM family methyltransferase